MKTIKEFLINVKIENIAKSIKALVKSFEINNAYGKDQLKEFKSQ